MNFVLLLNVMLKEAVEARPTASRGHVARRGESVREQGLFPLPSSPERLPDDVMLHVPAHHRRRLKLDVLESV